MKKFLASLVLLTALVGFADNADALTFPLKGIFGKSAVKRACGPAYVEGGGQYGCSKPCPGGTCAVGCTAGGHCTGKVPTPARLAPSRGMDALAAALEGYSTTARIGGGFGFSCNDPGHEGQCSCTGGVDSADCKGMAKNCDGEISCGWGVDNCTCKYKPRTTAGSRLKDLRVPSGGLLETNPGMPGAGGPASIGTPVSRPPSRQIN
jgi:hypothetical protein